MPPRLPVTEGLLPEPNRCGVRWLSRLRDTGVLGWAIHVCGQPFDHPDRHRCGSTLIGGEPCGRTVTREHLRRVRATAGSRSPSGERTETPDSCDTLSTGACFPPGTEAPALIRPTNAVPVAPSGGKVRPWQ